MLLATKNLATRHQTKQPKIMNLNIISAGAGSGKTYTLTHKMSDLLQSGKIRATGILATTFTNKAAAELKNRVRRRLLQAGLSEQADELENALIGTVHSISGQLLKRFAFEAGISPEVEALEAEDAQLFFQQALSNVSDIKTITEINNLAEKLGFAKDNKEVSSWRQELQSIIEIARANNFDAETLEKSRLYSIESFFSLLPTPADKPKRYWQGQLKTLISETLSVLPAPKDDTSKTISTMEVLRKILNRLNNENDLCWYEWQQVTRACTEVGAKSRELVADLNSFAKSHIESIPFREDVSDFINALFGLAQKAISEYARYKTQRGLIDFTDMEVLLLRLLQQPAVREVLAEELDLLLVDEFQDTNPIQLAIFLELTKIVKQAIWVGDPKQSIYGFRGADLELMEAVVQRASKNVEILETSYRSREDLVNGINGLFVQAFEELLPKERIVLQAAEKFKKQNEAAALHTAFINWHFKVENGGKIPNQKELWAEKALATAVRNLWESKMQVSADGSQQLRPLRYNDIAILCRSNDNCKDIANALLQQNIPASIAQTGLVNTPEIKLALAFLKYILNEYDSLALAELLRLYQRMPLQEIISSRLGAVKKVENDEAYYAQTHIWQKDNPILAEIAAFRAATKEFSVSETLTLLIEKWELRRYLSTWTNPELRIANLCQLVAFSSSYESSRQRLRSAATIGGFLLWLERLAKDKKDSQAKADNAVQVITYHASKGLEWKVVICTDLDNNQNNKIFGSRLHKSSENIDLNNPLKGQFLAYWPNPYANLSQNTELWAHITNHPDYKSKQHRNLLEEIRLLYVGFTRAGDYLILPTYDKKKTNWLNRVYHKGNEDNPAISSLDSHLMWLYNNQQIELAAHTFELPLHISSPSKDIEDICTLAPYSGEKQFLPRIATDLDTLLPKLKAQIDKIYSFDKIFKLPNETDYKATYEQAAQLFTQFLIADGAQLLIETRYQFAKNLLVQNDLSDFFIEQAFVDRADNFYNMLKQLSPFNQKNHNLPFRYEHKGQFYSHNLHLLLRSAQENIFVAAPAHQTEDENNNKNVALSYALHLYAAAQSLGSKDIKNRFFCLFPIQGKIYELSINNK